MASDKKEKWLKSVSSVEPTRDKCPHKCPHKKNKNNFAQYCVNAGPAPQMLARRLSSTGVLYHVFLGISYTGVILEHQRSEDAGLGSGAVFSYKLRYIVGFRLVEMAISTNRKPTIYRYLYENTGPDTQGVVSV